MRVCDRCGSDKCVAYAATALRAMFGPGYSGVSDLCDTCLGKLRDLMRKFLSETKQQETTNFNRCA